MSLISRQIDTILREYDKLQLDNVHKLDLRKQEVYLSIPELDKIDKEIAGSSVNWAFAALSGKPVSISELEESNRKLSEKKTELLVNAGYAPDYLELQYSCPECKDTGFIGNAKCRCFKRLLTAQLYKDSNIKNAIADENFNSFNFGFYSDLPTADPSTNGISPLKNIRKAVDIAQKFVDNFDVKNENLLIYGTTGVGKTFLCNCIAKAVMDSGHSVVYQTEYEFFDALKEHAFSYSSDDGTASEKYECIKDCDLLIIDDLGAELTNNLTASELFRVLNERILCRRSTIISTNLSIQEVQQKYSERILSRIIDNYTLIRVYGDDIRLKKQISGGQSNGQTAGNT